MAMKNLKYTIIGLMFFFSSCSLEENPESYITKETFYQTEEQCWSALRAIYTPLHHIYGKQFLTATEGATDLWFINNSTYDASLSINPTTCGVAEDVWKYAYKGIARANECIECIAESPVDKSVIAPMVAEARAMRGLYYHILTSFFCDVPFYLEAVSDMKALEEVRKLKRTPAETIRTLIYKDLKENALPYFTEENGLKCCANQVKNEHAGYALALMVMAKMAMWNEKWEDALYALDKLEETYEEAYGEFSEPNFPLEDTKWSTHMPNETIFEIQHAWDPNGVKFYGSVASVMSPKCSGNGIYDGVYMPMFDNVGSSSTPLKANLHYACFVSNNNSKTEHSANAKAIFPALPLKLTNELYVKDSDNKRYCSAIDMEAIRTGVVTSNGKQVRLDRRILLTLGLGNLETGEMFSSLREGGKFYGGPKFWCEGMTANYDSNNYRIMRYADAVLMQAECHMNLNNLSDAVDYLNKVKARAGIDDYTNTTNKAKLLKEIQDERARELGGEFQRKFDLVRWGVWYDWTYANNALSKLKANLKGKKYLEYYPIPESECALSGGALTNDAYYE